MAWVRIHDAALSHPKLVGLIDWKNPFCLWVWGLSYCQTHLTDGVIPAAALPNRVAERAAVKLVLLRLWEAREAGGFIVHDYLDWNESREAVLRKRSEAKDRMAAARERSSQSVRANILRTSPEVLRGLGKSTDLPKRTDELTNEDRAGILRQELYPAWYAKHRNGARLRVPIIANSLEFQEALSVVQTWDDARIEKLARVFLTTDEDWISNTDRSFRLFCSKATWCDDKLREWERKQGIA